jgi:hypothetical protein
MKRTLIAFLFLALLPLQAMAVGMDEPRFMAVNAVYVNAKHAMLSSTMTGIQTFARRAMEAAMALQAQAMQMGDETLANFAQGAYNYSKRASMSLTLEQARDYTEQAVSYAEKARNFLGARIESEDEGNLRHNLNNDQTDTAREVYYQLHPDGKNLREGRYEYK